MSLKNIDWLSVQGAAELLGESLYVVEYWVFHKDVETRRTSYGRVEISTDSLLKRFFYLNSRACRNMFGGQRGIPKVIRWYLPQ